MTYTSDELRTRYPEFADTTEYSDDRIDLFIADAQDEIGTDATRWGTTHRYKRALAALTAHLIVMGTNSEYGDYNPMQAISQKSAGEVKVHLLTGGTSPKSDYEAQLKATVYGQTFLALRRKSFVTIMTVPGMS